MLTPQRMFKSVVVEGNIGAGKTTFLRRLASVFPVQLVYEPHAQWQDIGGENLLDRFYQDASRWAYTFQTYAILTRVKTQISYDAVTTSPLQIIERSVYADRYCFAQNCFESGLMTSLEWTIYQKWFDWLIATYQLLPDAIIYLRTDPRVCYERVQKRARHEEQTLGLEYLHLLHQRHEEWLIHKRGVDASQAAIPLLSLACNDDFENNEEVWQSHVRSLQTFFDRYCSMQKDKTDGSLINRMG